MTRPDYCPVAQEPCQAMCAMGVVRCKIRDTHPQPKREWVGLTGEQICDCWNLNGEQFYKNIEAKLKELNT